MAAAVVSHFLAKVLIEESALRFMSGLTASPQRAPRRDPCLPTAHEVAIQKERAWACSSSREGSRGVASLAFLML